MKIKELEIGKVYTVPLVVFGATARETRTKKPYLALELYDGTDKISGNFWDWGGKNIPEKNTILNVSAQVTEWQGVKQLNISSLATNTDKDLSEFMPSSGVNIAETYEDALYLANSINDSFLRSLCVGILCDLRVRWLSAPGATTVHHAYTAGTLIHSVSVTNIARSIAEIVPEANLDLVTAGALLHDLGKLFGYRLNGVVCEMTDEGLLLEHVFMGAEFVGNHAENLNLMQHPGADDKIEMLRHIILSHPGKQEHGAAIFPASVEAHIIFHADSIDAITEMIRDASKKVSNVKFTEKIYFLNNKPHLTPEYVLKVMTQESTDEQPLHLS